MATWTCPRCQRQFGRRNQSHGCAPAGSIADYFDGRPAWQRQAFDRIAEHVESLGPAVIEAVQVGLMIKRTRTFAEVRRRRDVLVLGVLLSRRVEHPRITKVLTLSTHRTAHFVDLSAPDDVDEQVKDWLTEGYVDSPV